MPDHPHALWRFVRSVVMPAAKPAMVPALLAAVMALGLCPRPATAQAPAAAAAPAAPATAACPPDPQPPSQAELQQQAARPKDRGVLWRLQRDGRTSHLYGTLHVGRLQWLTPGPRTRAALQASRVLALELDLTDPATVRILVEGPSEGLPRMDMSPALQQRLAAQMARACLPPGALDVFHPVMRALTLTSLDARWEGLHGVFGSEMLLTGIARASGLRLRELETASAQIRALIPDDAAARDHLVQQALDDLERNRLRPVVRRLAEAWEAGRLDELAQYAQWCQCADTEADRALLRRLIDARNPGLAAGIDALHREGEPVFAAVGTLHMVGPQGLVALLRGRGFTVERVDF